MKKAAIALLSFAMVFGSSIRTASAASISLVRDAEIEQMLRDYALPIWHAAGIMPAAVKVYLVNDSTMNAFVTQGQRMFFNTGLILECDTPLELIGVLAHETGHMSAGHLVRGSEAMSKLSLPMIASMILGVGAMAAGAGNAGMAVLAGGAQVAQRSILSYSRAQEGSADQAAAGFLERAGMSGRGMLDLFAKFRDQEALSSTQQDPFIRSHPISEERLAALEQRVKASVHYDKVDSAERIYQFKMIQAKLHGFLDNTDAVHNRYPKSDESDFARYARSIAYHRDNDDTRAFAELDHLMQKQPNNPYFWEFKGQIHYESGRAAEAVPFYRKALALKPTESQFQLGLGQALLGTDKPASIQEAISYFKNAASSDPEYPASYYQLSRAYGKQNDIGQAQLATAQYYEALGDMSQARAHARHAAKLLKQGSPERLKAQDLAQGMGEE